MRLYRALPKDENILNSNDRAFSDDKKKIGSISILDEIYSHILPTHNLAEARNRRVIHSFTDDIDVACMFLKKYSKAYDRIGYIDIDFRDESSALINNNEKILLIKPVFRFSDWIDLATYNLIQNKTCKITTIMLNNTNYTRNPVPFINTLVPSRWGGLSLARSAREYAIICQNLSLTILSEVEIKNEVRPKKLKNYDLALCDISLTETINCLNEVINYLKQSVENIKIVRT